MAKVIFSSRLENIPTSSNSSSPKVAYCLLIDRYAFEKPKNWDEKAEADVSEATTSSKKSKINQNVDTKKADQEKVHIIFINSLLLYWHLAIDIQFT